MPCLDLNAWNLEPDLSVHVGVRMTTYVYVCVSMTMTPWAMLTHSLGHSIRTL
jgi:hypothetical protein